jgi:hypothetical protein
MTIVTGGVPQQSLLNQSATTAVGGVLDNGAARANHSLFVVSGAGVSAGVVTLQGSNDGVNWFSTAATVTTAAASSTFAVGLTAFPFQFVRAAITTIITGGTITATVASA